jgi:hypothetical protein
VHEYQVRRSSSHSTHAAFAAEEQAKAERVARRQAEGFSARHDALSPLLDEGRVADAQDTQHRRQKYELKTHIEAMKMLGDAMLRKMSGKAFR